MTVLRFILASIWIITLSFGVVLTLRAVLAAEGFDRCLKLSCNLYLLTIVLILLSCLI